MSKVRIIVYIIIQQHCMDNILATSILADDINCTICHVLEKDCVPWSRPLTTGVPLAWQQHYWKRRMMMPQMTRDCGNDKHGEWVWLQKFFSWKLTIKVLQHWRVGGETCSICFRLQSMHTLSTNMWLQIERKVLHSMSLFIWMKLVFSSMPSNVTSTNKCCCWCIGGIKTGLLSWQSPCLGQPSLYGIFFSRPKLLLWQ